MQRDEAWFKNRAGKLTASRVADVIAKTKSGYSTSRAKYRDQLVIERFGILAEGFTNSAMQHGIDTEPFARIEYEKRNFVIVEQVDFVAHHTIAMAGASPDGIVSDGLIEIKCPDSMTHFDYLINGEVPEKYKPQMAWQMACTGAQFCDFVSYDPRVPEGLQYFEVCYVRDDGYIEMLEKEVIAFLKEVDERFEQLKNLKEAA
jgi:putative phage-type endonuclease